MTFSRAEIFDPEKVGVYHCIARCVRRAFLCGKDPLTKKSFEHRRGWIRTRLSFLVEIFAIEVVAYAVMNNHLHSLIRNRPDIAKKWSAEEVALRWRTLFPLHRVNGEAQEPTENEIAAIANDKKLVELYRERLSSISWFNRCLNENIAKRANREDECKGRFWEGRFKCQRVYDLCGILACSAYIDLNPIRAGIAKTPEESDYTSVQDRIRAKRRAKAVSKSHPKLVSIEEISEKQFKLDDYLALVDTTGRAMIKGKGSIDAELAPILERLKITPAEWLNTTQKMSIKFKRVIGPVERLREAAERIKKSWFQGIRQAKIAFVNQN